jgi:hypothetical protein
MRPPTSEDLEFLRSIRGRFRDTVSKQWAERLLIFLFLIASPALWFSILILLFRPVFSFDIDHLLLWVVACGSLWGGFVLFRDRDLEYEFTGDEIIERRAGRKRNQIIISDVMDMQVEMSPFKMILKTGSSKVAILIFPALNEVIQKKGAESMAKQSEAERKHYEEVKQQLTKRLKWLNVIVSLVIVLAGFAVFLLIVWLKSKTLKR